MRILARLQAAINKKEDIQFNKEDKKKIYMERIEDIETE